MGISGSTVAPCYALAGIARAGATRAGYVSPAIYITVTRGATSWQIAGQTAPDSLRITDELNDAPNTADLTVYRAVPEASDSYAPEIGDEIAIRVGSTNASQKLFGGRILSTQQEYTSTRDLVHWACSCIDYTWEFDRRQAWGRYADQDASAVIADLVSTYASGFTTAGTVDENLGTIDEIVFTGDPLSEAISDVMRRVGGYWYVTYNKEIRAFLTDTGNDPVTLNAANAAASGLRDPFYRRDYSQITTRVNIEGAGSKVLAAVPAGSTEIPVDAIERFGPAAVEGVYQAKTAQGQILSYTNRTAGTGGALLGPGATPTDAPEVTLWDGGSIDPGDHYYAVTFVTASGESAASPVSEIVTTDDTPKDPPTTIGTARNDTGGYGPTAGGVYSYKYTYIQTGGGAAGETTPGPASNNFTSDGNQGVCEAESGQNINYAPYPGYGRAWYRTAANGSDYFRVATSGNYLYIQDSYSDADLGAAAPTVNTATTSRVRLTGIPIGPDDPVAVTARKIYRTAAGGSQLKLVTTISDNTTTIYTDAIADAALGADVPTSDNSGLEIGQGVILAGSTEIVVTGTAGFSTTGGTAVVGNGRNAITYTGISGAELTGVPATGAGSLRSSQSWGTAITPAPTLTGIPATGDGSLVTALEPGDPVHLFVTRDDLVAMAALAAAIGGDGIAETWLQDRGLTQTEAEDLAGAVLQQKKDPIAELHYETRDPKTITGKTATAALASPQSISASLTIQRVQIDQADEIRQPRRRVVASSVRFSLEAILRQIRQNSDRREG